MWSLTPVHSIALQGWDCMLSLCAAVDVQARQQSYCRRWQGGTFHFLPVYKKGKRRRSGVEGHHSSKQIEETTAR